MRTLEKLFFAAMCLDPDLTKVALGHKMTLCDGKEGIGTMASAVRCSADGKVGCLTSANYKSVDITKVVQKSFSASKKAGGIAGSLNSCVKFASTDCVTTKDLPSLPVNCSSDSVSGCLATTSFKAYSTISISAYDLRFGKTFAGITGKKKDCRNAMNTTISPATIFNYDNSGIPTGVGTGAQTAGINGDYWDTIDDYNAGLGANTIGPLIGNTPSWGPEFDCDGAQITDVSSQYSPSGLYIACDQSATCGVTGGDSGNHFTFSKVLDEPYSDLRITNVLSTDLSSVSLTWAMALNACYQLNSGDGVAKWRLPTWKEANQLYINGIGRRNADLFNSRLFNYFFWTSTSLSNTLTSAYQISLTSGYAQSPAKTGNGAVICVR